MAYLLNATCVDGDRPTRGARQGGGERAMSSKNVFKWVLGIGLAVVAGQSASASLSDWQLTPNFSGQAQFDQNFTALWVPYGTPGNTVNPNNALAAFHGSV